MKTFYSKSAGGFFFSDLHRVIPDDAVEITAAERLHLLAGRSVGRQIDIDAAGRPSLVDPPPPTPAQALRQAKDARISAVAAIVVTTATGRRFDGDEVAQGRMARAITVLADTESTAWVLADNQPATVSREELREALRLAGAAMTEIWLRPYEVQP